MNRDVFAGMKLSIVGNSRHVLSYYNGDVIDSSDVIFRMNKFNVSEDYEPHVGQFTDCFVTCFWDKVLPEFDKIKWKDITYVVSSLPKHECKYFSQKEIDRNLKKAKKLGYGSIIDKTIWIDGDFVDFVGDKIGEGKRPSTGTLLLCWLLNDFEFAELFCTGISFGSHKLHYNQEDYGNVGPGKKHHDPSSESLAVKYFLDRMDVVKRQSISFDRQMSQILREIT